MYFLNSCFGMNEKTIYIKEKRKNNKRSTEIILYSVLYFILVLFVLKSKLTLKNERNIFL